MPKSYDIANGSDFVQPYVVGSSQFLLQNTITLVLVILANIHCRIFNSTIFKKVILPKVWRFGVLLLYPSRV